MLLPAACGRSCLPYVPSAALPTPPRAGLQLAGLSGLRRLNVVVDAEPAESFDAASSLPPSLTWLGLTPCPTLPLAEPGGEAAGGGEYRAQIPACVLALPGLRFLDLSGGWAQRAGGWWPGLEALGGPAEGRSNERRACWPQLRTRCRSLTPSTRPRPGCTRAESVGLAGLDAALPRLTGLTGLALDHADLPALPPAMSLLRRLRLLSLHGVISMIAAVRPAGGPAGASTQRARG